MSGFIIEKFLEFAKDKGLDFAKEKCFENKLKEEISNFNSDFEREELDCNSFDMFLRENNNVNKIFNYIYGSFNNKYKSETEFINEISNEAYNYFNSHKEKIGHCKINNKEIFYEYFKRLMKIVRELIYINLNLEGKSIVKLTSGYINSQSEQMMQIICEMKQTLDELNNTQKEKNTNSDVSVIQNDIYDNTLGFTEEKKIKIASAEDVRAIVTVRYNETISRFKNSDELQKYINFSQKPFELELVEFRLMSGERLLEEIVVDKEYKGPTVKMNFVSQGKIELFKRIADASDESEGYSGTFFIAPEKIIENLKINLENENYETILSNISLTIEERKIIDNAVVAILSNKEQEDSLLDIAFIISLYPNSKTNVKVKVTPRKKESALYNLQILNLLSKLKNNKTLVAREVENSHILLEGTFYIQYDDETLSREIEFVRNIIYLQDKVNIKIDLSKEFTNEDIDEIFRLKEIINTGKVELRDRIITAKVDEIFNFSNLLPGKEITFTFKSNEKYEIFGQEVDLGTLLYIYSKVKIKSINREKFIGETLEGTKKLCISSKYYGDFSFEEICKREGLK